MEQHERQQEDKQKLAKKTSTFKIVGFYRNQHLSASFFSFLDKKKNIYEKKTDLTNKINQNQHVGQFFQK